MLIAVPRRREEGWPGWSRTNTEDRSEKESQLRHNYWYCSFGDIFPISFGYLSNISCHFEKMGAFNSMPFFWTSNPSCHLIVLTPNDDSDWVGLGLWPTLDTSPTLRKDSPVDVHLCMKGLDIDWKHSFMNSALFLQRQKSIWYLFSSSALDPCATGIVNACVLPVWPLYQPTFSLQESKNHCPEKFPVFRCNSI